MNPDPTSAAPIGVPEGIAREDVRTAVEELMHRVDELDATAIDESVSGAGELAILGRQAALFEQAHEVLVNALDAVDRA